MKLFRVVKWSVAALAIAGLIVAGVLYYLIDRPPAEYEPLAQVLTPEEKISVRRDMDQAAMNLVAAADPSGDLTPEALAKLEALEGISDVRIEEVVEVDEVTGQKTTHKRKAFKMTMGGDQMNRWAGALTEETAQKLSNSGISGLAVSVKDNRLSFFANVDKYDKVVGVALGFETNPDQSMTVQIEKMNLGSLPMGPEKFEQIKTAAIKTAQRNINKMSAKASEIVGGGDMGQVAGNVVQSLGGKIADAIEGRPIKFDLKQAAGNARIRGVSMEGGKLTLDVISLGESDADSQAEPQPDSTAPADTGAEKAACSTDAPAQTDAEKAAAVQAAAEKARRNAEVTQADTDRRRSRQRTNR